MKVLAVIVVIVGVAAVGAMPELRFKRGSASASASSSGGGGASSFASASSSGNDFGGGNFPVGFGSFGNGGGETRTNPFLPWGAFAGSNVPGTGFNGCPGFGCNSFGSGPIDFGVGQYQPGYGYNNGADFIARMLQHFSTLQQPGPHYYPNSYGGGSYDNYGNNNGYDNGYNTFQRLGPGGGSHRSSVSSSSSGGPGGSGFTFSRTENNGQIHEEGASQGPNGQITTYSKGPEGVQTRVLPQSRLGSGGGNQGIYSGISSQSNPNGSVTVQKASGSYKN